MNITQSTKGENLISIKINVEKADYEEMVEKTLKQMRQRANVPGFRPGMVPMGMIKKLYGASAKMEALNNIVSDNLNKHIVDNKLNLLGYPLNDPEKGPADLDKEDDLDFYFEAALRPEINVDFTNTMVDFYHIIPTDEEVDKVIEDLLERNPNTSHPDTVGEDDRLEIKIREAKDGKEVEGGWEKDGFYFYSFTRTDGFNSQERARAKSERYEGFAHNAHERSAEAYNKAHDAVANIPFGQPILVGHHSEGAHRAAIRRSGQAMDKSVAEMEKAQHYESKAEYWERMADKIDLSMPESIEFYEHKLSLAKEYHEGLKSGKYPKQHAYSVTYANKAVNEAQKSGDEAALRQLVRKLQMLNTVKNRLSKELNRL